MAAEVTDEHNDVGQLHPMIKATNDSLAEAGIDQDPKNLLADAGYASEENFAALDEDDPDCYVATRNMKKNPRPRTGRRGPLKKDATLVDRMDRKVSNKKGNALYRRRQAIIEPVFGQIKQARGIRGFCRRGKAAAESEWKLICGTHNLLKLYRRALSDPTAASFSRIGAPGNPLRGVGGATGPCQPALKAPAGVNGCVNDHDGVGGMTAPSRGLRRSPAGHAVSLRGTPSLHATRSRAPSSRGCKRSG